MIKPTREEWLAAREALAASVSITARRAVPFVEAILGPCPPEPAPAKWRAGEGFDILLVARAADGGVWVGFPHGRHASPGRSLTADVADAMAAALVKHAAYARMNIAKGDAEYAARG